MTRRRTVQCSVRALSAFLSTAVQWTLEVESLYDTLNATLWLKKSGADSVD